MNDTPVEIPIGRDSATAPPLDTGRKPLSMGRRAKAIPIRHQLEQLLNQGHTLELDFEGIQATQSFMDELVGVLVLERGPEILKQMSFKRCSADMKAIISFVVSDRAAQHAARFHQLEVLGRGGYPPERKYPR